MCADDDDDDVVRVGRMCISLKTATIRIFFSLLGRRPERCSLYFAWSNSPCGQV